MRSNGADVTCVVRVDVESDSDDNVPGGNKRLVYIAVEYRVCTDMR